MRPVAINIQKHKNQASDELKTSFSVFIATDNIIRTWEMLEEEVKKLFGSLIFDRINLSFEKSIFFLDRREYNHI